MTPGINDTDIPGVNGTPVDDINHCGDRVGSGGNFKKRDTKSKKIYFQTLKPKVLANNMDIFAR